MSNAELLSGTRVPRERGNLVYDVTLSKFIEHANALNSEALIVSQYSYTDLATLTEYIEREKLQGKVVNMVLSETHGVQAPADLCNMIVTGCINRGLEYFAIVSVDLVNEIPTVMPKLLDRLRHTPDLAMIGVSMVGVHDQDLLQRIRDHGSDELTAQNFGNVFTNNAFALYRLHVHDESGNPVSLQDRLFPRETDNGYLGRVIVKGEMVDAGGNEEMGVVIRTISQGIPLNAALLIANIQRDINSEMALKETTVKEVPFKVARRQAVAAVYQRHFRVSDETMNAWLKGHYSIIFDEK